MSNLCSPKKRFKQVLSFNSFISVTIILKYNEICCLLLPLHTLNLTLSNSFSYRNLFNYEIKDKNTNEKVFELAHFSTRLQHPMERHLVQLVFRLSRDNLLFRKKKFILIETFTVLTSSCNVLCY